MSRAARQTKRSFQRAGKRIEKLSKNLGNKMASGLRLIGEEIMLDVKAARPNEGVPVDKGTLRSSGRVSGPKNDEVELSFGGAAAPYALEQHENVDLKHRVGEARYLVRGVERWAANGASVKRAMKRLQDVVNKMVDTTRRRRR